jgi:hypothetical protein
MTTGQNTKEFVTIADIRDTLVILKNGSLRSVIEVNAVNFDLKSEDEQNAIIQGFQNFLNFIDFPLQISVSSRKLEVQPYLDSLEDLDKKTTNELLKIQIGEYQKFIKGLTELANIMLKKFYVVVPFYPVENKSSQGSIFSTLKSVFNPTGYIASLNEADIQNYKSQIDQRISVILGALTTLGVSGKILTQDELKNLYYSYYNPGQIL